MSATFRLELPEYMRPDNAKWSSHYLCKPHVRPFLVELMKGLVEAIDAKRALRAHRFESSVRLACMRCGMPAAARPLKFARPPVDTVLQGGLCMVVFRLLGAFVSALVATVVLTIVLQVAQGIWDPLHNGLVAGWEVVVMFGGLLYFAVRDVLQKQGSAANRGAAQ